MIEINGGAKFVVIFGHNLVPTEIDGDTIQDAIQSFHLDNLEYLRAIPGAAMIKIETGELDSPRPETWHFLSFRHRLLRG